MVEVTIDGKSRSLEIREPTEGDRYEWLDIAMQAETAEDPKTVVAYLKYEMELLCRLTGLSIDEFKKLGVVDGDKLRAEVIPQMTLWREKALKKAESDVQDFSTGSEQPPTSSSSTQKQESTSSKQGTETKESPQASEE